MDPFDEENHEKKKNPHDPFRGDDDIFRDIFNDNISLMITRYEISSMMTKSWMISRKWQKK